MKTVLFILMCFLILPLFAQNYTFTHGSVNSGGGHQVNTLYSNTTAFGEYVTGEVSTGDYTGYLGFLFPLLDQRPPINLTIEITGTHVVLNWDSVPDATYKVYSSENPNETFENWILEQENITVTTWSELIPTGNKFYRVTAENITDNIGSREKTTSSDTAPWSK